MLRTLLQFAPRQLFSFCARECGITTEHIFWYFPVHISALYLRTFPCELAPWGWCCWTSTPLLFTLSELRNSLVQFFSISPVFIFDHCFRLLPVLGRAAGKWMGLTDHFPVNVLSFHRAAAAIQFRESIMHHDKGIIL